MTKPFEPGFDPRRNTGGRPKGSKNKLGEEFISDLYDDWTQHGAQAIADARKQSPLGYVRVAASLLPKELKITRATDELTDEQLAALIAAIDAHAATDSDLSDAISAGIRDAKGGESAKALQTVH